MSEAPEAVESPPTKASQGLGQVVIRSYASVVYLYPSLLLAIGCGLWVNFSAATPDKPGVAGIVFALFFFFNLTIIAFDYTRLTSVVIILLLVILALVTAMYPGIGDVITDVLSQPLFMNSTFYWVWAIGIAFLLIGVFIKTRFDYWEVKNNELLHHHGLLGDVERWPAPNMRNSKEITDVLEFALLRSGRLVLMPAREPRAIVIDNVPNINHIEHNMQKLLSTLRVADAD